MLRIKTFKFRLYPTKIQQKKLWKWSIALNNLYNHYIELQRVRIKTKESLLRRFDMMNMIVDLRKDNQDLSEVYADCRQACATRVAVSYTAWLQGNSKEPRFRSGYNFFNITYPDFKKSCKLTEKMFYGGKLCPEGILVVAHRPVSGNIKMCSVHCDEKGKWFLLLNTEENVFPEIPKLSNIVGIDVGCKHLCTLSDGYQIDAPNFLQRIDDQINEIKSMRDTYHKPTGSKKKGTYHTSRRHKTLSKTIRKLYGYKHRLMQNFLHTRTRKIVDHYDVIVVENMSIKGLMENDKPWSRPINKQLGNVSLGMFRNMLDYKSKRLIQVNPAYTSQMCAICGQSVLMELSDRTMNCPTCHAQLDRDFNAAINIRNLGIHRLTFTADSAKTSVRDRGFKTQIYNTMYPLENIS